MKKKQKKLYIFLAPVVLILGLLIFSKSVSVDEYKGVEGCFPEKLSGEYSYDRKLAMFNGEALDVPEFLSLGFENEKVLGTASPNEKWIEVDLSEQKLRAWDGSNLFLETSVATGLPWWKTPTGEFRIWMKLRYANMEGGEGKYYYNLPNVPFVMYFEGENTPAYLGYGLHGTYWHNSFGTPRSHGCVNLPTSVAEKLFYWTTPEKQAGKWTVRASENNLGTRIVIHD